MGVINWIIIPLIVGIAFLILFGLIVCVIDVIINITTLKGIILMLLFAWYVGMGIVVVVRHFK